MSGHSRGNALLRRTSVLVILLAAFSLFGGSATVDAAINPPTRVQAADEATFVALINELRVDQGLAPLEVHPILVPLARDWAVQLRSQNGLSHAEDLSVGVDLTWTRLGENVGVGPQDQIQELFDAFVASPSHYANLVRPDYRYVGIGVVYGDDGRIWTTHRFMALDPSSDQGLSTPKAEQAATADPAPATSMVDPVAPPPATTAPASPADRPTGTNGLESPPANEPAESAEPTDDAVLPPLVTRAEPTEPWSAEQRAAIGFVLDQLGRSGR